MTQIDPSQNETSVLFNGACPVCSAEINHYAKYSEKLALPVKFEDLGSADLAEWGVTQDEAARRLHVRHGHEILSGLPAFQALWAQMPRYRWLAKLTSFPVIRPIAAATYDYALAPLLYHWQRILFAGAEKTGKSRHSS